MKKLIAIILCVSMVFTVLVGCAAPAAPVAPAETAAPAATQAPVATQAPAATEAPAAATEAPKEDVVKTAAMAYFANYDSAKIMKAAKDFFAAIDAGEEMFVIDIRQPDAYAEGHIKGAVNIPFGAAIAQNLSIIPDDTQVYVYCYSGQTASQTVALLNVAGKPAANVQKGFNGGISVEPGFENHIDKETVALPTDKYDVDPAIQAAIDKYFADMAAAKGTAFESFNFKPASLKEVLDAEDDSYVVYSIRKAEDYAKGHIPTAINNPFGAGMQEKFAALPTDKTIIVQCYTGQTASQTTAILRLLGFNAYNLQGGMGSVETKAGWLGAGFEVVTG